MEQLALIADLLELGRIGSADARGLVQPVQIEKSLREQVEFLAGSARERSITVETAHRLGPAARARQPRSDQEPVEQPGQQRHQVQPRRRAGRRHAASRKATG